MRILNIVDVLRYYVIWNDYEKEIFLSVNEQNNIFAFNKYLIYMRIKRNFRKDTQKEILHSTIEFLNTNKTVSVENLSNIYFNLGLLSSNNKNAFVASSKILWLFNRNYIIMDRINLRVLNSPQNKIKNYFDYLNIWKLNYNRHLPIINKLIKEYNLENIDNVFIENWFKQRIFDLFLWNGVTP